MHWVVVEGIYLPKRVGGHPALDFCNTYAGWRERSNPRGEWLRSYEVVARFAGYVELLEETDVRRLCRAALRDPEGAAAVLVATRRFRTRVHSAVGEPSDARLLGPVTRLAQRAAGEARLRPGPDGAARWEIPRSTGLEMPLLVLALSAAEMLTSPEVRLVKSCPGSECGWMFIDSRGRRRWCSMSACGNRAKVRAFSERQRART
ncbi:MAG: CGNR zinc finger domain-containing protein [Nocardioidaceae bacterium]|nr:CGNR zinc finger domain-containing protein [Nocardioidaceae bacterium]